MRAVLTEMAEAAMKAVAAEDGRTATQLDTLAKLVNDVAQHVDAARNVIVTTINQSTEAALNDLESLHNEIEAVAGQLRGAAPP